MGLLSAVLRRTRVELLVGGLKTCHSTTLQAFKGRKQPKHSSTQSRSRVPKVIEFLSNYGLFTLKLMTVLVALAALGAFLSALVSQRQSSPHDGHLEVVKLNDRLEGDREVLRDASLDRHTLRLEIKRKRAADKAEQKAKKREHKKAAKTSPAAREEPQSAPAVYVLDFHGDLQASGVGALRREITAVLSVAQPQDEVVVRLDSGGGLVHSYGLGASQLQRIVDSGLKLTVCVDKVAASGGYMMACVGTQIIAAPFALLGSIGVVAQLPNFHRLLQKHDVDFELVTAGKHKRTLTIFGKNTEEGRHKFEQELEETHGAFKDFVQARRPQISIEDVATGEVWLGVQALPQKLVDRLATSDQYLGEACQRADVFEVKFQPKRTLQDRLSRTVEQSIQRMLLRAWEKSTQGMTRG